jgi:hypothetical protein
MKKFFSMILVAVSLLSVTGCFDITEEITVNKDGSGQYVNKIDATKMAEQMQMLAAMDTTGEMIPKLKYSLDSSFASTWDTYKNIKGISNVKVDTSKAYVYIVTFNYANIDALNEALAKDKSVGEQKLYSWEKGKLTRQDLPLNMNDMKTDDEQQKEMMKTFLAEMKYRIVFHLPNNVKDVSNKAATISDDKKTVTVEANLLEITEDKVKLGTQITYK